MSSAQITGHRATFKHIFQALWKRLKSKNQELLPHEKYPEILQWQEGDKIECRQSGSQFYFKITVTWVYFISISQDGMVYIKHNGEILKYPIDLVMSGGVNASLMSRQFQGEIDASDGYMEAMKAFQEAIKELRR